MGVKQVTESDATPSMVAARSCEPSIDQMLDYLTDHTGMARETVKSEIDTLRDEYQFLTPLAAAYRIGQQHGLQPAEVFETVQRSFSLNIANLQPELNSVDLTADTAQITSINTFDRDDGSTGKVCNLILEDGTGRCILTLWDDTTALTAELENGDTVRIENGYSTVASDYCQSRFDCDVEVRLGDDGTLLQKQDNDWMTVTMK